MRQNATNWTRLFPADFYPTINLVIGKPDWPDSKLLENGKCVVTDFDTGCPAIIFDGQYKRTEIVA